MLCCTLQRGSVIVSDGVLLGAAWYATRRWKDPQRISAFLLVTASAGLLIVDHIHFQYNGLLLGARPGLARAEENRAEEYQLLGLYPRCPASSQAISIGNCPVCVLSPCRWLPSLPLRILVMVTSVGVIATMVFYSC